MKKLNRVLNKSTIRIITNLEKMLKKITKVSRIIKKITIYKPEIVLINWMNQNSKINNLKVIEKKKRIEESFDSVQLKTSLKNNFKKKSS